MGTFWQSLAKSLATCNQRSTRIPHSHLQYLAYPLAIFGVPGLRIIFKNAQIATCNIWHIHSQRMEYTDLEKFSKNFLTTLA